MDAQEEIFGLIIVAREQQQAAKAVLDELAAERAALAREHAALAQQAEAVRTAADSVQRVAEQTVALIQRSTGEAVTEAVALSLAGAAKPLEAAVRPVLGSLSRVMRVANEAEGKLAGAVAAFSWKWVVVAGAAAAGAIIAILAAGLLSGWWQRHQIDQLAAYKAALEQEVAQLQVQAEDWAMRAGRAQLQRCGDTGRLCVRVDKSASYGDEADYFVLRGY